MQDRSIYQRRVSQFADRVMEERYGERFPLAVSYTYDARQPIPYEQLTSRKWKPIVPGTRWGDLWGSAWFRFSAVTPREFAGSEVCALVDLGSEGAVFRDGVPYQGLTDAPRGGASQVGKRRIRLFTKAAGNESVELLVEAGANALFGHYGHRDFILRQAEIAILNRERWQLGLDLKFLEQLAATLPSDCVRARRILTGLNDAANVWADGTGSEEVTRICRKLLKARANESATTAWSVGHAHMDLAWLWPVRETRRKAGRTFSTALRMIEEYPEYVFGASQPQMYAWVKEDYPKLYAQVKDAVRRGRWECQGAMWVEPDMNITGGESLVRQLLYGKRFFREEFQKDVKNLWLPDVFGYSAALPQILRLAGVESFMTQKISWNETNKFPHHTFDWEGIDGSRVRSHFLATDNYNCQNSPAELQKGERQFAQADVSDDWLNLYGIGDGGGGPSRNHIEMARRAANTEGLPRVRMAPADDFFSRIGRIPANRLPVWKGELYLELHRGTLTTQARMKKLNRRLETTLRDVEFLATLSGVDQRRTLAAIWEETLLNQFHDILPGSSIEQVYLVAISASEANLRRLEQLAEKSLTTLHGAPPKNPRSFVIWNTQSWTRNALAHINWATNSVPIIRDSLGRALPAQQVEGGFLVSVSVPPMGATRVEVSVEADEAQPAVPSPVTVTGTRLENSLLRVGLNDDGTIKSIYDKEFHREALAGVANQLLAWEDLPYSWDAWDISHYYRETTPEQARLTNREVIESGPLRGAVRQTLSIGASDIIQRIVLEADSRLIRIETQVAWKESHRQLRVQARPAIRSLEASYEIQFGTVQRPAHANTSWDAAKFEVSGHRFADFSQADYGVGIVNDSKYGHRICDGVMDLTLLRSPTDPDAHADIGEHEFVFGYYPHALGWQQSELLERSHELNAPLIVRGTKKPGPGEWSEFSVSGGEVKLETVKPAEDGTGVILRFYETRGGNQKIVFRSRRRWSSLEEVNLLEETTGQVRGTRQHGGGPFASEVSLVFGPYQIRSFRMILAE